MNSLGMVDRTTGGPALARGPGGPVALAGPETVAGRQRLGEWLRHAARLHPSEIELGLERIAQVIGKLGIEPPPARVVTVAGTNGKGSTAALIEAALRLKAGLRTALYLSPYLQEFGERAQIGGAYADADDLSREFERVEAARGDIRLTEFEFVTLAAFSLFSRSDCEAWVLEIGLGGRLDAVNAIDPDVSVITRIAMDHQDWLGDTLDSVAAEKAGILRAGCPALYGAGVAPAPIAARAVELDAPLYQANADFGFERANGRWHWRGRTVRRSGLAVADPANAAELPNASLAFAALECLDADWVPESADYQEILQAGRLPGRFERMEFAGAEWVLDVAHNPDAGACLARSLDALPPRPTVWVLGMHSDKDAAGFMRALPLSADDQIVVTRADWPRAYSPDELAEIMRRCPHATLRRCESVAEACGQAAELAAAKGCRVVVTGSFNTVGPARTWLLERA